MSNEDIFDMFCKFLFGVLLLMKVLSLHSRSSAAACPPAAIFDNQLETLKAVSITVTCMKIPL